MKNNKLVRLIWFIAHLILFIPLHGQTFMDRHSTTSTDAWVSCRKTISPNASRDSSHWLMIDLGGNYALHSSKIWNLNTPNYKDAEIKEMVIDYSLDGQNWQEFRNFGLESGKQSGFYEGQNGPDFGGLIIRYILISVIKNHGHSSCSGLGEIKFEGRQVTVSTEKIQPISFNFILSPNPTSDFVNINLNKLPSEDYNYHLTDLYGRLLMKGKINESITQLDISNIPAGTYIMSLINPLGIKSKKIIVNPKK